MEYKLENNHYQDLEEFTRDAKLIFANCRHYNGYDERGNQYTKAANMLERQMDKIIAKRTKALGVDADELGEKNKKGR
jgi:histone acetyltransferase